MPPFGMSLNIFLAFASVDSDSWLQHPSMISAHNLKFHMPWLHSTISFVSMIQTTMQQHPMITLKAAIHKFHSLYMKLIQKILEVISHSQNEIVQVKDGM